MTPDLRDELCANVLSGFRKQTRQLGELQHTNTLLLNERSKLEAQ